MTLISSKKQRILSSNTIKTLSIWVKLYNPEKDKDKEYNFIITVEFMRVYGIMIRDMEEVTKSLQMEILIKENIVKEKLMEKVFLHGLMAKFMMVNGSKASKKDMEYGKEKTEILILVNGKKAKLMDSGCIFGKMEIGMRVNGKLA